MKSTEKKVVGKAAVAKKPTTTKRKAPRKPSAVLTTDDNLALLWIKALTDAKKKFDAGKLSLARFQAIISAAREVKNLILVDGLFGSGEILQGKTKAKRTIDVTDSAKVVKKNLLKA